MDPVKGSEVIIKELLMPKFAESYEQLAPPPRAPTCSSRIRSRLRRPSSPSTRACRGSRQCSRRCCSSRSTIRPCCRRCRASTICRSWAPGSRGDLAVSRAARRAIGASPCSACAPSSGCRAAGDPIFEGQFSPHGTLALYSRVLARAAARLAAERHDDGHRRSTTALSRSSRKLEDFLAAGEPPVVFTLGTSAVGAAGRFYHESAAAAAKLGVRAVLLTGGFAQNRPDDLPPNVLLVDRAPHQLCSRARAPSCISAAPARRRKRCASGRPTLLVPHGHDQFDNARRVRKLGVARTRVPERVPRRARRARPARVADDASYRERAAATASDRARGSAAPKRPPTSSSDCSL